MRAQHINITISPQLRVAVDQQAKREKTKRSSLIQKAVRVYLGLAKSRELRSLMQEGYQELNQEARLLGQEYAKLDAESLKHVD